MPEEKVKKEVEQKRQMKKDQTNTLAGIGWGLFFIWLGIGFMMKVATSIILLGLGVITLGIQIARKFLKLKAESFWIVLGLFFIVVGLWDVLGIRFALAPIILIIIGLIFLLSALKKE